MERIIGTITRIKLKTMLSKHTIKLTLAFILLFNIKAFLALETPSDDGQSGKSQINNVLPIDINKNAIEVCKIIFNTENNAKPKLLKTVSKSSSTIDENNQKIFSEPQKHDALVIILPGITLEDLSFMKHSHINNVIISTLLSGTFPAYAQVLLISSPIYIIGSAENKGTKPYSLSTAYDLCLTVAGYYYDESNPNIKISENLTDITLTSSKIINSLVTLYAIIKSNNDDNINIIDVLEKKYSESNDIKNPPKTEKLCSPTNEIHDNMCVGLNKNKDIIFSNSVFLIFEESQWYGKLIEEKYIKDFDYTIKVDENNYKKWYGLTPANMNDLFTFINNKADPSDNPPDDGSNKKPAKEIGVGDKKDINNFPITKICKELKLNNSLTIDHKNLDYSHLTYILNRTNGTFSDTCRIIDAYLANNETPTSSGSNEINAYLMSYLNPQKVIQVLEISKNDSVDPTNYLKSVTSMIYDKGCPDAIALQKYGNDSQKISITDEYIASLCFNISKKVTFNPFICGTFSQTLREAFNLHTSRCSNKVLNIYLLHNKETLLNDNSNYYITSFLIHKHLTSKCNSTSLHVRYPIRDVDDELFKINNKSYTNKTKDVPGLNNRLLLHYYNNRNILILPGGICKIHNADFAKLSQYELSLPKRPIEIFSQIYSSLEFNANKAYYINVLERFKTVFELIGRFELLNLLHFEYQDQLTPSEANLSIDVPDGNLSNSKNNSSNEIEKKNIVHNNYSSISQNEEVSPNSTSFSSKNNQKKINLSLSSTNNYKKVMDISHSKKNDCISYAQPSINSNSKIPSESTHVFIKKNRILNTNNIDDNVDTVENPNVYVDTIDYTNLVGKFGDNIDAINVYSKFLNNSDVDLNDSAQATHAGISTVNKIFICIILPIILIIALASFTLITIYKKYIKHNATGPANKIIPDVVVLNPLYKTTCS